MLRGFAFFVEARKNLSDAGYDKLRVMIDSFYQYSSSPVYRKCLNGDTPEISFFINHYLTSCKDEKNEGGYASVLISENSKSLGLSVSSAVCNSDEGRYCLERVVSIESPSHLVSCNNAAELLIDGWPANDVNGLCAKKNNSIIDNLDEVGGMIGIGVASAAFIVFLWCLTCIISKARRSNNKKTASNLEAASVSKSTLLKKNDANDIKVDEDGYCEIR